MAFAGSCTSKGDAVHVFRFRLLVSMPACVLGVSLHPRHGWSGLSGLTCVEMSGIYAQRVYAALMNAALEGRAFSLHIKQQMAHQASGLKISSLILG